MKERLIVFISILIILLPSSAFSCDYLHQGIEQLFSTFEFNYQRRVIIKEISDLDGDQQREIIFANQEVCGATGNCGYHLLLSNHGCAKFGGQIFGSSIFILKTKHDGISDIANYWKGGHLGLLGTWAELHFKYGEYKSVREVKCESEIKAGRPSECPPWHGNPTNEAAVDSLFIDTIPKYQNVIRRKSNFSSEKLGPYMVERVETLSLPANTAKIKDSDKEVWAEFLLENVNSNGIRGDDTDWFKHWSGILPITSRATIDYAALIRSGSANFGVIGISLETKGMFHKKMTPVHLAILGVVLLNEQLIPLEVKNVFGGQIASGENRRILAPKFFADVNRDGYLDIILKDVRYAGEGEKILFVNENSKLVGPLSVTNLSFDSWD